MAARTGTGLVSLVKRGWHEIPEVMAATVAALVGTAVGGVLVYRYSQRPVEENHMYRQTYTVKRPEDVRNPESKAYN